MSYLNQVQIPRSVGCVRFLELKIIQLDFKRVYTHCKQTATGETPLICRHRWSTLPTTLTSFFSLLLQTDSGPFTSSLLLFVDDTVTASVKKIFPAHFFRSGESGAPARSVTRRSEKGAEM